MTKQQEILSYLATVEAATLDEIYENVSFYYYANHNKHLGEILSRMVKAGTVERVKKGVFKIGIGKRRAIQQAENENQTNLF